MRAATAKSDQRARHCGLGVIRSALTSGRVVDVLGGLFDKLELLAI